MIQPFPVSYQNLGDIFSQFLLTVPVSKYLKDTEDTTPHVSVSVSQIHFKSIFPNPGIDTTYLLAESDAHDDGAGREDDGGEEDGGLAAEALAKGPGHQREQPCRTDLQMVVRVIPLCILGSLKKQEGQRIVL